jgi:hypothetical protein
MLQNITRQQLSFTRLQKAKKSKYLKKLTQLKNRYLLVIFGIWLQMLQWTTQTRMTRLRIAMVKTLESSLGIVRTFSYFCCRQHFRKRIMTDSIKTAILSAPCYNEDTTLWKSSIINFRYLRS